MNKEQQTRKTEQRRRTQKKKQATMKRDCRTTLIFEKRRHNNLQKFRAPQRKKQNSYSINTKNLFFAGSCLDVSRADRPSVSWTKVTRDTSNHNKNMQSFFFGCQLIGCVSWAVRPSISYNYTKRTIPRSWKETTAWSYRIVTLVSNSFHIQKKVELKQEGKLTSHTKKRFGSTQLMHKNSQNRPSRKKPRRIFRNSVTDCERFPCSKVEQPHKKTNLSTF